MQKTEFKRLTTLCFAISSSRKYQISIDVWLVFHAIFGGFVEYLDDVIAHQQEIPITTAMTSLDPQHNFHLNECLDQRVLV